MLSSNFISFFNLFIFEFECENQTSGAINRRHHPSSFNDKSKMQFPMKIPKLSLAEKIALIIESGPNLVEINRKRKDKGILEVHSKK